MIGDPATATAGVSGQGAPDHAARYELLRTYAAGRRAPTSRDGLVVLVRQGLAAWMEAWSDMPVPPPVEAERQHTSPLSDEASAEVVHILAAMTWGHIEEMYV